MKKIGTKKPLLASLVVCALALMSLPRFHTGVYDPFTLLGTGPWPLLAATWLSKMAADCFYLLGLMCFAGCLLSDSVDFIILKRWITRAFGIAVIMNVILFVAVFFGP